MDLQQHHERHQSRMVVTDILSLVYATHHLVLEHHQLDGAANGRFGAVLEQAVLLRTITVAGV